MPPTSSSTPWPGHEKGAASPPPALPVRHHPRALQAMNRALHPRATIWRWWTTARAVHAGHSPHHRCHRGRPRRDGGGRSRRPSPWCSRSALTPLFTFIYSPRPGHPGRLHCPTRSPQAPRSSSGSTGSCCSFRTPYSAQKHAAYVGTLQRVLVDGKSGDSRWPLSARTAGGRLVHLVGDEASIGRFKTAKITDSNTWALFGELTE